MSKAHNPEALNKLLETIIVALLDEAHERAEGRTGKKIEIGALQKAKLNLTKRLVTMGLKQMRRFGDPQARFDKMVELSNEHLPKLVDIFGEEEIVSRLKKIPRDALNAQIVDALEDAGAIEIATLLNKALPEGEAAVLETAQPKAAIVAPAVAAGAAAIVEDHSARSAGPVAEARALSREFSAEAGASAQVIPPSARPPGIELPGQPSGALPVLKDQLAAWMELRDQADSNIAQLRAAIERMEQPEMVAKPMQHAVKPEPARPGPDRASPRHAWDKTNTRVPRDDAGARGGIAPPLLFHSCRIRR